MANWLYFPKSEEGFDKHIDRPMHQIYHIVYKANTGVKEIWFRFVEEIVKRITIKQWVDLCTCIYIETERKKEKEKGRKMDSISDRLVHFDYLRKSTELSPILNQFYDLTYLKLTVWRV